MTLKFFDAESPTSGDLPFASDYLKENPKYNGEQYEVTEVVLAQSNKGYMVKTDSFILWLWKKQKLTTQLIEALKFYTEQQDGYKLVAVLDKTAKSMARLAIDFEEERTWFAVGNESYSTQELGFTKETSNTANPFLPAPQDPSLGALTATTPKKERGGRGK